jgi:hypothetical protein
MVKGLIRFGIIYALTMLVTPYVDRWLRQLAARAPQDSFIEEVLQQLSTQYSASLIRSFGETVGELVFGSKK